MAATYATAKGRKSIALYITFPNGCLIHENFKALSGKACKMLFELASQYRGYNNGDLQATWKILSSRGWRSKETIHEALKELTFFGWIITTRQGGLNRCSLYAITFLKINGNSKLDFAWATPGKDYPAPGTWRNPPGEKLER